MFANACQHRARALTLSLISFSAMAVSYLMIYAVLSDPDMTDKLMNGVAPPGTAVIGNQFAVITAVIAALAGWGTAVASRRVIPVLLVILATVPLVPIGMFTFVLAFDS